MDLTPEHLRASYEIYMKYGNSSSATIISVLNKLRESEGKERVIACAFGPGIALEMMVLRRRKEASSSANGFEDSEANGSSHHDELAVHNVAASANGVAQANGNGISTQSVNSQHEQLATNGAAIETALLSADGAGTISSAALAVMSCRVCGRAIVMSRLALSGTGVKMDFWLLNSIFQSSREKPETEDDRTSNPSQAMLSIHCRQIGHH